VLAEAQSRLFPTAPLNTKEIFVANGAVPGFQMDQGREKIASRGDQGIQIACYPIKIPCAVLQGISKRSRDK
jgi:hypothetical protein